MEREGFLAAGVATGPGSAHGFQIGYGVRVDSDEMLARCGFWLSRSSDGDVDETALRAELVPWPVAWDAWPWGSTGPILGLGFNDLTSTPHEGFGGFFTLGWEVAVWSPQSWQVMLGYEHHFGISSESSDSVLLSFGYAHKKLTIGPVAPK